MTPKFIVTVIKDETTFRHPSLLMGSMLTAVLYFDRPPSSKVTKIVEHTLCSHCQNVAKASKCVLYVCTAIHTDSSLRKGFPNFQEELMKKFDNNDKNELDTLQFWGMTFITEVRSDGVDPVLLTARLVRPPKPRAPPPVLKLTSFQIG